MLLPILLVVGLIVLGWFVFEGNWDRGLFASRPGRICENVSVRAAVELLRSTNDLQVLDVRSPSEFAAGALPGAINIDFGGPSFTERVSSLDKTKPVLIYCAGGYRSRKAVRRLLDLGFNSIHHLHRGYLSWRLAGKGLRT